MTWNGNFVSLDISEFLKLRDKQWWSKKNTNEELWKKTISLFKFAKSPYASELEKHFNGYQKLVNKINKNKTIIVNEELYTYALDCVNYLHFSEALTIAPFLYHNWFGSLYNLNGSQAYEVIDRAIPLLLNNISKETADIWQKLLVPDKRDTKILKIRGIIPNKDLESPFTIKCNGKEWKEFATSFLVNGEAKILNDAFLKILKDEQKAEKLIKNSNIKDMDFIWSTKTIMEGILQLLPSSDHYILLFGG